MKFIFPIKMLLLNILIISVFFYINVIYFFQILFLSLILKLLLLVSQVFLFWNSKIFIICYIPKRILLAIELGCDFIVLIYDEVLFQFFVLLLITILSLFLFFFIKRLKSTNKLILLIINKYNFLESLGNWWRFI